MHFPLLIMDQTIFVPVIIHWHQKIKHDGENLYNLFSVICPENELAH